MGPWLRLASGSSSPARRHFGRDIVTDGENQLDRQKVRRGDRAVRGHVPLRLPWRGHRLGGERSREISTALLGTVDIVPDPAGLAADFQEMMRGAMGKNAAGRGAAGVDTAAGDGAVRQAGRAGHRRPDRRAGPVRRAGRRLPDRRVGAEEGRDSTVGVPVNATSVGAAKITARVGLGGLFG